MNETMATMQVNGEERRIAAASVIELLRAEGVDPARRGVAVALNGQVVRRADWADTALSAGDAVEIVKPFAGGSSIMFWGFLRTSRARALWGSRRINPRSSNPVIRR